MKYVVTGAAGFIEMYTSLKLLNINNATQVKKYVW